MQPDKGTTSSCVSRWEEAQLQHGPDHLVDGTKVRSGVEALGKSQRGAPKRIREIRAAPDAKVRTAWAVYETHPGIGIIVYSPPRIRMRTS